MTFNLQKKWYKKFLSGEKTIEYREVKPYWTKRLDSLWDNNGVPLALGDSVCFFPRRPCILRLGYTKRHMTADITRIEVVNGKDTDLAIDAPVYAIHLANVREER